MGRFVDKFKLPTDDKIALLASTLEKNSKEEKRERIYASTKEVLRILAMGSLLTINMIAPGTALLWKEIDQERKRREDNEWKKFNLYYLRRTIKRLEKQKLVEITEKDKEKIVKITINGKQKIVKYSLENLKISKPRTWDKKWRVVIWDVPCSSDYLRKIFRESLNRLGFLMIQKSVFLYPYPCYNEILFLREYYAIGAEVIFLVVEKIENDASYKEYFGLI